MTAHAVILARTELQNSLKEGRFHLAYQAQFDLKTGAIVGFEGVARWHHQTLGEIGPGLFLGLMAREGLRDELNRQLLKQAAEAVVTWAALNPALSVSINVAVEDTLHPDFAGEAAAIVTAAGARPWQVVIEAPEDGLALCGEGGFAALERLKARGFRIALDAKGPPAVALDKRARGLFAEIKCGGGVMLRVARRLQAADASLFLRRLNAASAAGIPTTAVGAETRDSLDLFRSLGFLRVQGYALHKASCLSDATDLVATTPVVDFDAPPEPVYEPVEDAKPEITADALDVMASHNAKRLRMFSIEEVTDGDVRAA